jgi:putative copper export protein
VIWRVISADGHPVSESFVFRVAAVGADGRPVPDTASFPVAPEIASGMGNGTSVSAATLTLSLFRAAAMLSVMSFLGLLLVPRWKDLPLGSRVRRVTTIAAWAVPITLPAHLAMWIAHVSRSPMFDQADIGLALGSSAGEPELARLALGLLAAWAFLLARRRVVAAMFAGAAVIFGAAAGHPAAFTPILAIPMKSLHLIGGSVWIGGLLSIMLIDLEPGEKFIRQAARSSSVALIAVMAVTVTGAVEAVLFLNTPADLLSSAYGRLVLAKLVGLIGLVAFGAYHRNRMMQSLSQPATAQSLQRSVRNECALMVLVMLIGAFMSNVPTPPVQHMEGHSMPEMEMT